MRRDSETLESILCCIVHALFSEDSFFSFYPQSRPISIKDLSFILDFLTIGGITLSTKFLTELFRTIFLAIDAAADTCVEFLCYFTREIAEAVFLLTSTYACFFDFASKSVCFESRR